MNRNVIYKSILTILLFLSCFLIVKKHVSYQPGNQIIVKSDIVTYVNASRDLLSGKNIYYDENEKRGSYVYPPFFAMMLIPTSILSDYIIDVLWFLLNLFLLWQVLKYSYSVITNSNFKLLDSKTKWFYGFFAILFSFRFILRNFQDGNVNIFMLFLIVTGMYLICNSDKPYGAVLIGLAASIKIFPLIFIFYFLGKKKYKEILYMILTFLIAMLIPSLIIGLSKNLDYLKMFFLYGENMFSPAGIGIENFSFWGTIARVFSENTAFELPQGVPHFVNILDVNLFYLKYFIYFINIIILILCYYFSRKEYLYEKKSNKTFNYSFVLVLLFMNQISINIQDHHLVTFLVVFLYLLILIRHYILQSRFQKFFTYFAGIISILVSYDIIVPLFGKLFYFKLLSFSIPDILTFLLLLILVILSIKQLKYFNLKNI